MLYVYVDTHKIFQKNFNEKFFKQMQIMNKL